jgi:uncharacterized tellurite resistance protein B-like protein
VFGRWRSSEKPLPPLPPLPGAEELTRVIQQQLPEADVDTVRVVVAMTGLLGAIAYADRNYSELEEKRVRSELSRVHGMTAAGIDAICTALRRHIIEVSTVQAPRYCRDLLELGDRELRFEVLGVLVEVAAADGVITPAETNLLRQTTTALGLTQLDYNELQQEHRQKLSVLKT